MPESPQLGQRVENTWTGARRTVTELIESTRGVWVEGEIQLSVINPLIDITWDDGADGPHDLQLSEYRGWMREI
jgi:hypothetical protein